MKSLLPVAVALAALVSLAFLLPATAAEPTGGAVTFSTYCVVCHGETGAGDGPGGAALDPSPPNFQDPKFWEGKTDEHLTKVIKEGGAAVGKSPMMIAWESVLTDAQIAEVIAHLKTLKK